MRFKYIKKNITRVLISCSLLLFLAVSSCMPDTAEEYTGPMNFNATDLTNSSNYIVNAKLVYNGSYCKVYKNQHDIYMSDINAKAMGVEFDNNIYEKIVNTFGTPSDVDGNGKIILLILDIKDGSTGNSFTAGYFDPANEFDPGTDIRVQYSNSADMIYMDSNPGSEDLNGFKETMAHEFQHLINFNQKAFVQRSGSYFDTWIDEGMSSAAEQVYSGSQIQSKIDYYNKDTNFDIEKGQRFIAWQNKKNGAYSSIFGNYSTVYLFFQWLSIQSDNSSGIYKIIMDDPAVDGTAVYNAAKKHITGFNGSSFGNLLRDWLISNIVCSPSGYNGYKGVIPKLTNHMMTVSSTTLLPGECIYRDISAGDVYSNSDPVYSAGVSSTGTVDYSSPYSAGTLLVYNSSMTADDPAVSTAILPSEVLTTSVKKLSETLLVDQKNYPVDAVLKIKDFGTMKK